MTGWYQRRIVPHIVRLGCGCELMADYRRQIVPKARGRVLEIGLGAGANLRFYDAANVTQVIGIEPSPELRAMAMRAERPATVSVEVVDAAGEALPFEEESFDTIVCTFTLCTVEDVGRTLAEARRVLKQPGRFLFCEHGRSPDQGVQKWQQRIEPVWKRVFGGCHITRPVRSNIERYFAIGEWTGAYQGNGPRVAGWMEWGEAIAITSVLRAHGSDGSSADGASATLTPLRQ
jgi:SAM-dependent methyltransferase